jgi:hypothetical protein
VGYFSHNLVAGAVHTGKPSVVGVIDTDAKNSKHTKTGKMQLTQATVAGINDTAWRLKFSSGIVDTGKRHCAIISLTFSKIYYGDNVM